MDDDDILGYTTVLHHHKSAIDTTLSQCTSRSSEKEYSISRCHSSLGRQSIGQVRISSTDGMYLDCLFGIVTGASTRFTFGRRSA